MKQLKKTLLTLVALLAVTTGAWATTPNSIVINGTPQVGDKSISLTYHFDPNNVPGITSYAPTLKVKCAADNKWDEMTLSLHEVSSGTTIISLNTLGEFEAGKTYEVCFAYNNGNWVDEVFQSFVPAASGTTGPEVAWDKATKTGTFTMPGGNVTLEPEYYPQAALTAAPTAINDVPATTDGAIVKAGTVATIGSTETAQGTVMYYVSQTALDDAALLALAADKWTADVPTAEKLTKGQAYVYYYVRGNDSDTDEENFSDGDILAANALTVTIAAEPTYAVTFAEGTDPNEWTASPAAGVKKGTEVTVNYTGSKKVLGVKAEKKGGAAGKPVSEITPDDIFKVIASDGIIYDNIAAAESAGTVAQGLIVYVGSNTGNENYNHGLALALNDENSNTQGGAINACNAKNTSTPIVDALWILPSQGQWNTMFNAAGSDWKLRDCFSSAGGNNMVKDGEYWSSSGDSEWVIYWMFSGHDWEGTWGDIQPYYNYSCNVRACIVF